MLFKLYLLWHIHIGLILKQGRIKLLMLRNIFDYRIHIFFLLLSNQQLRVCQFLFLFRRYLLLGKMLNIIRQEFVFFDEFEYSVHQLLSNLICELRLLLLALQNLSGGILLFHLIANKSFLFLNVILKISLFLHKLLNFHHILILNIPLKTRTPLRNLPLSLNSWQSTYSDPLCASF